ncbi:MULTISPECIES: tetratricopeptide repeat-containing sulfotransferase family protein [unclassified Sphingomonas]|uniref:tetratricopeptide repeat-containing sulfotransferase family protein n=1 Tax=unclassified Sphingomonas TaxID=196159 RepID=UPI00226A2685|nr:MULTISPECIES: tetratricopeptide repeat-containing sulfotransferase family protein [unclassified Sphingomonas]
MDQSRPTTARAAAIRASLARGGIDEAFAAATRWRIEAPHAAEAHFLAGISAAMLGKVTTGIALVEAAVARDGQGEYLAQLARLYTLVRRDEDAARMLQAAEASPPADALGRDTMGCVYARLGDHAASLPHFAEAVRLEPANIAFRYNEAAALSFVGQPQAAEAALEALIALAPADARAHHLLAGLRKQTPDSNHVDRLVAARKAARAPRDRLLLGYALAKELDDLGDPTGAFAILAETNAEHRATLPYRFGDDAATFDAVESCWPQVAAAVVVSAPQAAPIFVVGMPRTGTTLVDRILSSHPDVESAGELQAMPLAVKAAAGTRSPTVLDPATIAAAANAELGAIGRDYLARAAAHVAGGKPRFIDKFPGNFLYVGLIARALPEATIVCLRRNPMDTILANFRNLFAIGSRYYDYSYDLLDIAAYYHRFDRLMAMWHEALPGRVLELHYESLVARQEPETRRLLDHCGLSWSDACLDFQANAAPVSTPSAAQVRRPLYKDAVDRWRRHAEAMAPARAFLGDHGIVVD